MSFESIDKNIHWFREMAQEQDFFTDPPFRSLIEPFTHEPNHVTLINFPYENGQCHHIAVSNYRWNATLSGFRPLLRKTHPDHPGTKALLRTADLSDTLLNDLYDYQQRTTAYLNKRSSIISFIGNRPVIHSEKIGLVDSDILNAAKQIPQQANELRNRVRSIGAAALFLPPHPEEIGQLVATQEEKLMIASARSSTFLGVLAFLPAACLLIVPIGFAAWNYSQRENTIQSKMRLGLEIATNFLSPISAISLSLWGEKFISNLNQEAMG